MIELSRELSITGVLIDEEGNPVRAAVGALKLDDAGRPIPRRGTDPGIWAKTDDQGRWELTGLPPGRYEVETVQIPLTRLGSWGLGEVEIRIAWPDGSPARERAEPLFVRIVPDDREVPSTIWPPIDAAAGKTTPLTDLPTGRYRVYAWSEDGEWVSPPRRVDVVEGESATATLAMEAGGTLLPKLPPPESRAKDGEFRLTDARGVRLAVAWLDLVPTTLSALGPLPAGLVRVELLSGGSPVATGEVVVEPGRRTEVLLSRDPQLIAWTFE